MRKNGITTKRKILTVCVQLFLEQWYTNTTITQITEQAKVTRSSFQHLFTIATCTARKILKGFSDSCSGFQVYFNI